MKSDIKRLQLNITFVFCIFILITTIVLSMTVSNLSSRSIRSNVSKLITSNSRQIQLNIDSYLTDVENAAALMFSDAKYYSYNPVDSELNEYQKIQRENAIFDKIVDIGMLKNFSDFGMVYADDSTVGWISQITLGMFSDGGMYEDFQSYLGDDKSQDAWVFGVQKNYDRLYYFKRINDKGILVLSIYLQELESVFKHSEELGDMKIYLIDDDNRILYSDDSEEINKKVSKKMATLLTKELSSTLENNEYLVTTNRCSNGWRVMCSIPLSDVTHQITRFRNISIFISIGLFLLFTIISYFAVSKLTSPVSEIVHGLDMKASLDRLTNVYNRTAFEERVAYILDNSEEYRGIRSVAFIMIDMDNFKAINDAYGHSYGDQVIIRTANVIKNVFSEESMIVARMGGDEFAAFVVSKKRDYELLIAMKDRYIKNLYDAFDKEFEKEINAKNISLSVGVSVKESKNLSFKEIYDFADKALYDSKNNGKNRATYSRE